MQPPGVEYFIESKGIDGQTRRHFASPESPHPVNVYGQSDQVLELRRLAEWHGQRSLVRFDSTRVRFGSSLIEPEPGAPYDPHADLAKTDRASDGYWLLEADYTYRPLRTVYDFRFGFGVMRGQWPQVDGQPVTAKDDPGVNCGRGEVNLMLNPHFVIGGQLILGANAEGFVGGGGGRLIVGRPAGPIGLSRTAA